MYDERDPKDENFSFKETLLSRKQSQNANVFRTSNTRKYTKTPMRKVTNKRRTQMRGSIINISNTYTDFHKEISNHSGAPRNKKHKIQFQPFSFRLYTIKSIYLLIVSIFFFSLSLLFIKILNHNHKEIKHSNNTINFFSGFFMFVFSMIFMKLDHVDLSLKKNFNKQEIDYLLIRSSGGFFSIHFTILALNNMRLISAVTLIYLSPIITSFIMMKQNSEKIKKNDKIVFILSLIIIVIFIVQDFSYGDGTDNGEEPFRDSISGVIYSILAAILNSFNNIVDKKVCYEFHSYIVLFVMGIISIIFTPIFMSINGDKFYLNAPNLVLFFLLGASTFFSFYFTHKSIEANSLLVNSPLHYITIGLAYIYSIVVFEEQFTFWDIISSCFIIVINYYTRQRLEDYESEDNI